jgi:hypothetical protein
MSREIESSQGIERYVVFRKTKDTIFIDQKIRKHAAGLLILKFTLVWSTVNIFVGSNPSHAQARTNKN